MSPAMAQYPHLTSHSSFTAGSYWPTWGQGYCLTMGCNGALGTHASCNAATGCPGTPDDFCGAGQGWTSDDPQLEVFYSV